MKATGIIRRIDNLGRIVIPKEIRTNLRIKNGENLEIYINENEDIVLTKHSPIDKLVELAQNMTEAINIITKKDVLVANTNQYISITGTLKQKYQNKPLSNKIITLLEKRQTLLNSEIIFVNLTEEVQEKLSLALSPIISQGDIQGVIIIASKNTQITKEEAKITQIAATFFAKHIEQ